MPDRSVTSLPGKPHNSRPDGAETSYRMTTQCCDFSPPASRTATALVVDPRRHARRPLDRSRRDHRRSSRRRQGGYGRGRRMAIESDRAEILSGVRRGETIGGPIALLDSRTRLGELAAHDARRRRAAGGRHRGAHAPPSRVRGRAMPISPAASSTATTTFATCSSAPARARPPRASPPAPSRGSCWRASASTSPATSRDRRRRRCRAARGRVRRRPARIADDRRCAASIRTPSSR